MSYICLCHYAIFPSPKYPQNIDRFIQVKISRQGHQNRGIKMHTIYDGIIQHVDLQVILMTSMHLHCPDIFLPL